MNEDVRADDRESAASSPSEPGRPTGISRRQLLMALGAAGGAGAVLGALAAMKLIDDDTAAPFTPPSEHDFALQKRGNDTRVLVLGAGVAGLCCAYELGKAGYQVTLIDARTRVGGRSWTVRSGDELVDSNGEVQRCEFADGRWLNPGPARIAQHHTTLAYCRELGIPIEVLVNANTDAYVVNGDVVRRRRSVQGDYDGYVSELLSKSLSRHALDTEVPVAERELLRDHLQAAGALGRGDRGYVVAPGLGTNRGTIAVPDDLATVLRLGFDEVLAFEREFDQAAPMFHPVGGMDAIPRALANAARADLRLGHEVVRVTTSSDGVEVTATDPDGDEVTFRGDLGICAIPPTVAARLDTNWGRDVVRALAGITADNAGKIGLEYDRRFWEIDDRIFGGITHCGPPLHNIWYPSTGYLGAGGVIVGAYPWGEDADHFGALSHAERVELCLSVGERIHGPSYRAGLRSAVSVCWSSQVHSEAAWCYWEDYGDSALRVLRGDGRWWFAGDWLTRNSGWQHSAFESARRAVSDLHRRVLDGVTVAA